MLREGQFVPILWRNAQVGDIVRLRSGIDSTSDERSIPADLILLASSEPMGLCYIETSSLDGYVPSSTQDFTNPCCRETNLKVRQPIKETSSQISNLEELIAFLGKPAEVPQTSSKRNQVAPSCPAEVNLVYMGYFTYLVIFQEAGVFIQCEAPNNRLYNFDGSITINGNAYPLDPKQVLLRVGCFPKSTSINYFCLPPRVQQSGTQNGYMVQ